MKRRIFINLLLVSVVTVILTAIVFTVVSFKQSSEQMKDIIRKEARYISLNMDSDYDIYFKELKSIISNRITLIAADGTVLFDSEANVLMMENHSDRREFISARETGTGEVTRLSATLDKQTSYYAIKLDNGSVIRVAYTTDSIYKEMFNNLEFVILLIIPLLFLCIMIARIQTKFIVKPINQIDLENPEQNIIYDEITPLLSRIVKQNESINGYIATLNKQQSEFSAITENMNEGLIILDEKSTVLSLNKSALRILGIANKDCTGQNILTLNRSDDFIKSVEKAQNGKYSESNYSMGNKVYLIISSPVKYNENTIGVVIIIVDITEKHEREAMRHEFSANVSHELKTPLTSISGYAEIMKNGLVKPQDIQRFSEKIYSESKRLIDLIEDIIKLSKLDETNSDIQKESVNLYSLAEDVKARLSSLAESRNVSIELTGNRCEITGVRYILDEMLFNLCDNAIKYNIDDGKVNISITETDSNVLLSVSDTGIGIPEEAQERVFERFYRVDKSHSKETGGTGLGLSIVKHGAAFHNADIKMKSIVNKGTEITIAFQKNDR